MSQKNLNVSVLKYFYPLGKKVRNLIISLSTIAVILLLIDMMILNKECEKSGKDNSWACVISPICVEFYASIFVLAFTLSSIELAFRNEMLEEIQTIFQSSEATKYLKAVHPKVAIHREMVRSNLRQLDAHEQIKMLCLSETVRILNDDEIGKKVIVEKLQNNCQFKILTLHPDSLLLDCLNNVKFNRDRQNLVNNLSPLLKELSRELPGKVLQGSLEVRLHKDVFSPFCYFSSKQLELIWIYCLNSAGFEYPAFEILHIDIIKEISEHFETIWSKSSSSILFKFEKGEIIVDKVDHYLHGIQPEDEQISQNREARENDESNFPNQQ
jgi:hypothetical protein